MDEWSRTFSTFLWFVKQTVTVGGLGSIWVAVPLAILVIVMIWKFPKEAGVQKRLWPLLLLPALWVGVGLWGARFWLDWQNAEELHPDWMLWPAEYSLAVGGLIALGVIIFAARARLFALSFSIVNLYFLLSMSFLASMALTGVWL